MSSKNSIQTSIPPNKSDSESSAYTSASDVNTTAIFVDNNKGAIPKTSTPIPTSKKGKISKKVIPTSNHANTPPINKYFCRTNRVGETVPSPVPPPNILDWYEAVDLEANKYQNSPLTVLGRLEPLPQRTTTNASKRKRINSNGKSITTANSKDGTLNSTSSLETANKNDQNKHITSTQSQIPWLLNAYSSEKPLPETLIGKHVRFNNVQNNTESATNTATQNRNNTIGKEITTTRDNNSNQPTNPPSIFQEGDGNILLIPEDAQPFFKRSRGCLSAASRADARATHIEEMVTRGITLPWALRIEPIPAYLANITPGLTKIQKKNALALQREAAQELRKTCTHLTTQGTMNWNIVANIYGADDAGLTEARHRMDSLVARDFTREQGKLEDRKDHIFDHQVKDYDIIENLKIRGYNNPKRQPRGRSPNRANPPAAAANNAAEVAPNQHQQQAEPNDAYRRPGNRGKRRRSNSRSRSRSPNRGRGRQQNRYGYNYDDRRPPRGRGYSRGQNRYQSYQQRNNPPGQANLPDPDQLGAIIRQVVEQFNYPPPNNRGRDNYRK